MRHVFWINAWLCILLTAWAELVFHLCDGFYTEKARAVAGCKYRAYRQRIGFMYSRSFLEICRPILNCQRLVIMDACSHHDCNL